MKVERRHRIEWPTMVLAGVIYGGWAALVWWHAALPTWLLVAGGAWCVAWQSSLQHELVHGHPTRWPWLNRALGLCSLALWVPFDRYRALHLAHHRDERLTDPYDDPESFYWAAEGWAGLSRPLRMLVQFQTTLLGRLTIGPLWSAWRFAESELRAWRRDDPGVRRAWRTHALTLLGLWIWVCLVCGMSPWLYIAAFAYPGTALLMLRSFAEHRAHAAPEHRTAVVEGSPILGLLFLFNNLHAAHHARPSMPWFALPAWYRQNRDWVATRNGGLIYRGYRELIWRFLLRPHDDPVHPAPSTR